MSVGCGEFAGDRSAPGGGHGDRARTPRTVLSAATIAMPRARIEGEDGNQHDWPS
jgi:hypothetical protein